MRDLYVRCDHEKPSHWLQSTYPHPLTSKYHRHSALAQTGCYLEVSFPRTWQRSRQNLESKVIRFTTNLKPFCLVLLRTLDAAFYLIATYRNTISPLGRKKFSSFWSSMFPAMTPPEAVSESNMGWLFFGLLCFVSKQKLLNKLGSR